MAKGESDTQDKQVVTGEVALGSGAWEKGQVGRWESKERIYLQNGPGAGRL